MVSDLYLDAQRRFASNFGGCVVIAEEMLGNYVELVVLDKDDDATDLVHVWVVKLCFSWVITIYRLDSSSLYYPLSSNNAYG